MHLQPNIHSLSGYKISILLHEQDSCKPPLHNTTTSHLDDPSGRPHVNKVLPLQDGPEATLQRDDPPQNLLVEGGLETLTLGLPQEHLVHTGWPKSAWPHLFKKTITKKSELASRIHTIVFPTWYPAGCRWICLKNSLMPDLVGLVPRGSSTWKCRTKSWRKGWGYQSGFTHRKKHLISGTHVL